MVLNFKGLWFVFSHQSYYWMASIAKEKNLFKLVVTKYKYAFIVLT